MENAIEIKNVGKKYNITHQRGSYVSLRDVITNILKNPFKHFKHKAKKVLGKIEKEEFWALKDINLTIKKGEIVGIIGANGAGKSTLLKLLSRITPPTTGEIKLHGRVASLLEVGTGFHPELTGRENIFLNGAILGMTKKEIVERFDDIVEFSGVKQFIDTPVKRYSSGMYVRLAFAVAAHMEPDILVVDEVLAVGDAEFQKKSLGKLDSVSKSEGRTILFVSHNMAAIQRLCSKTVLLEGGEIKMFGETKEVIKEYLNNQDDLLKTPLSKRKDRKGSGLIKFTKFHIEDKNGNLLNNQNIKSGSNITFVFGYKNNNVSMVSNVDIGISLHTHDFSTLSVLYSSYMDKIFQNIPSIGEFRFKLNGLMLTKGKYKVGARIVVNGIESDWPQNGIGTFEVSQNNFYNSKSDTPLLLNGKWELSTKK